MRLLLIEPYDTGSHAVWLRGYQRHSAHDVRLLTLEGKFWQWRMLGGAVTLAEQFLALDERPDLIVASDMLDLTTFLALTRPVTAHMPVAVYFHENQLTYPGGPRQKLQPPMRDSRARGRRASSRGPSSPSTAPWTRSGPEGRAGAARETKLARNVLLCMAGQPWPR